MRERALQRARTRTSAVLVMGAEVSMACRSWSGTAMPFFGVWDRSGPVPVARARSVDPGCGLARLGYIAAERTEAEE